MSLAYYMDHNIHAAVTAGLRGRGVDCLTADEHGRADWGDADLLQRASDLRRVVFTTDRDFLTITAQWLAAGRAFAGVVYAHQRGITVGRAIDDLQLLAQANDADELRDTLTYIPL